MQLIGARHALLAQGWKEDVLLGIEGGQIREILPWDRGRRGVTEVDLLIPGMCNAHSHSFQRAFSGLAECRAAAREDFWSWRERMYATAEHIGAEEMRVITRKLYSDLLLSGYTHVAEFHYLHRPGLARGRLDSANAILAAAKDSGIGLTLLPTLYRYGDFGRTPPGGVQRRFAHNVEEFCDLAQAAAESAAAHGAESGIAFHSLRAVEAGDISATLERLGAAARNRPKHIHIAEQQGEVERARAVLGMPPVQALLQTGAVDASWSLVHATHAGPVELEQIAQSGATIVVCPTTEANLGDGIFPLERYLALNGALAIGSDSHVALDPAEELRLLEYSARLDSRRRLIAASDEQPHTGANLWRMAAAGGARSCGINAGVIEPGRRADLVALDTDNPQFAGRTPEEMLDTHIFGGAGRAVRDVMVAGSWRVRDGRLQGQADIDREYSAALRRLRDATSTEN